MSNDVSKGAGSGSQPSTKGPTRTNSPVSSGDGPPNPFLDLDAEGMGLMFRGMVITVPEVRSGTAKGSGNPYAISTQKLLAGGKTFILTVVRKTVDELGIPPKVGTIIQIKVESADKQSRDSDIELQGEIVPLT